ncbi:MAG: VTT domain-containing protein [Deltaproteobacteria bacterium]|jgi:uncharacterized membrane protein YdjX (TVP38/TMEM64 family)
MAEMKNAQDKWHERIAPDVLRLVLVGLGFLGIALLLRHEMAADLLSQVQEVRSLLKGAQLPGGEWSSSLLFLLAGGALISFGVPRLWVSGVAGAIYGFNIGAILALGSSMIGAATVYAFGRFFLASMVQRRAQGRLATWSSRFRENGFWWVLYGRLFPFSNATFKSLLCGSCRVPFWPYLAGSFLGFIPLTMVFAAFGSGSAKGNLQQVLLGFCLLFGTWLCRRLVARPEKNRHEEKAAVSEVRVEKT